MNKLNTYKYYFIYRTKNLLNGKSYVGFHSTNKIYDGYKGSGVVLKKDIKKYGKDYFITGILEFCNENNWQKQEKYWIDKLNTYNDGYNLTKGGDGGFGLIHSERSKKIMSEKHSGKKLSETHKRRIGKALAGNLNLGGWNKGLYWNEDTKQKISQSNLGKTHKESSKKSMSQSKKKLYSDKINHPRSKIWIVHTPDDNFLCIGTFRKFRDKNKSIYNKFFKDILKWDTPINGWYFKEFKSLKDIPSKIEYKLFS